MDNEFAKAIEEHNKLMLSSFSIPWWFMVPEDPVVTRYNDARARESLLHKELLDKSNNIFKGGVK